MNIKEAMKALGLKYNPDLIEIPERFLSKEQIEEQRNRTSDLITELTELPDSDIKKDYK